MLYGFKLAPSINSPEGEAVLEDQIIQSMHLACSRAKTPSLMNATVVAEYLDFCDSQPSRKDMSLYAQGVQMLTQFLTSATPSEIGTLTRRSIAALTLKDVLATYTAHQGVASFTRRYR